MNSGARVIAVIVVGAILGLVRYSMRSERVSNSPPRRDDIVSVGKDDPRMAAAIAEAQRKWGDFLKAFEENKPERLCAVKAAFKVRGGGSEHMWIKVASIQNRVVKGTLLDEPNGNVGKKQGDSASVAASDVEDWLYTDGKRLVGGFTQKVLDEIQVKGR